MTAQPEASEEALQVLDAWQKAEGEIMRDGHRYTLLRLIQAALTAAYERGREDACKAICIWCTTPLSETRPGHHEVGGYYMPCRAAAIRHSNRGQR